MTTSEEIRNGMLTFSQRVVFVGFGSVAQCTLPILLKHVNVTRKRSRSSTSTTDHEALEALDRRAA